MHIPLQTAILSNLITNTMKTIHHLLFIGTLILSGTAIWAQSIQFDQLPPLPPAAQEIANFVEVEYGTSDSGDVDGDGDLDVIIAGRGNTGAGVTELYINDGNGNFTPSTSAFTGAYNSALDFGDVDGDGDLDVLVSGILNLSSSNIKLYLNDGSGNFTEATSTPFALMIDGTIDFFDMENDGDMDLLTTGMNSGTFYTKLYENDGTGGFTEILTVPFEQVRFSAVVVEDVNGDVYDDIVISGINNSSQLITKLYTNSGGTFTEVVANSFTGLCKSSVDLADIDGDTDLDLILSGYDLTNRLTKLYTNDGSGLFTEVITTPFVGVEGVYSSVFCDIDNDNDPDLLLSGKDDSNQKTAKLYQNDGTGTYAEITPINILPFFNGSAMFADLTGDGYEDLLTTGNQLSTYSASYYVNDGAGDFIPAPGSPCIGVNTGGAAFADFNGDNMPDIFLTGSSVYGRSAYLYFNNGSGNFYLANDTTFTGIQEGQVDVADVNGDTYIDIIMTGLANGSVRITKLYTNDGLGNFTEVLGTPFPGVENGSVEFADMDNDGDQDLLLTGFTGTSPQRISKIYENDGAGNFSEVLTAVFPGVQGGSTVFEDFNGDGYRDILLTGYVNGVMLYIAKLYLGDGSGNFTEQTVTPFEGVIWASVDAADIDGDSDLDILITGELWSGQPIARLYENDGLANFTEIFGVPFTGVSNGAAEFVDLNGDGAEDLMITGETATNEKITELFINDGSGGFNILYGLPFEGVIYGAIAFDDIDADSDIDVLIAGRGHTSTFSRVYTNSPCTGTSLTPISYALPDIQSECDVTSLTVPMAYGNCGEGYEGTTTATLPITTQGTTVVTWTYDDGLGNTITQDQNVVIQDITAPVADAGSLADLTGTCSVSAPTAPTATDNCSVTITGVPDVSFPVTAQDTTIVTWSFDDGNGNITTQTQLVIINDNAAPAPDLGTLPDLFGECSVSQPTAPTATDNCAGSIQGIPDLSFPITTQGSYTITWTFSDGNGNSTTQSQNVVVSDTSGPAPDVLNLPDVTDICEVTLSAPTASDTCSGQVTGTPDVSFPITTVGTTTVTWTYTDNYGNTTQQTQNVIITGVNVNVTQSGLTLTSGANSVSYQWLDCNNSFAPIAGETNQSFTATANGSYAVQITDNLCVDTSACFVINDVGMIENDWQDLRVYPNPTTGTVHIDLGENTEAIRLQLMDSKGQLVREYAYQQIVEIDFEIGLEAGAYWIRLITDERDVVVSLVKL